MDKSIELAAAFRELEEGKSLREVANSFHISYIKLYRQVKASKTLKPRLIMPFRGAYLYPDEEDALKSYLLKCAENGLPRTILGICEDAGRIIEEFPRPLRHQLENGIPGKTFATKFVKRKKNLSLRKSSKLSTAGAFVTERAICYWFEWAEAYLKRENLFDFYNSNPRNVWNLDETPFSPETKPKKTVGARSAKRRYTVARPNTKENYSVLFAGTANAILKEKESRQSYLRVSLTM